MSLPTNKQVKDLFDGLLGRPCTISDAADQLSPDASPAPAYAVYVTDDGRVSSVVMMEFALAAYTGAALALIPPGGAEAAVEDKVLPASLMENTAEVLNVLASPLGDARGRHQRLESTYGPHDDVPAGVKANAATLGLRADMVIEVGGYGSGRLAVVAAV
ncbi:hypothetical protein EXE58_11265 [Nocardioides seonyuensis]|uniref:Chemotaxis protein CheX n=1 Tax=Nocardioides seonyuensis TaxID=2518371 RepID=A0A4P7IH37_9ACTN|nr:hypothetical protein [Nocardioides seonyuensis]QBX55983.1 hypothetical protein EXE58_11265 [Nocardioides seonyuensis]